MQDEIILIISMVVCILMFLSYFDLSGTVGKHVSGFLFGTVGLLAYALPFILFLERHFTYQISEISGRQKDNECHNILIALTAFIQLITESYSPETKIVEYYTSSRDDRIGGGIIGGGIVMLLCECSTSPLLT